MAAGHPSEGTVSYGTAAFHGDLSDERSAPVWMILGRKVPTENVTWLPWLLRSRVGLGFDLISTKARHDGNQFPFNQGEELDIFGFFIMPNMCFFPETPVHLPAEAAVECLHQPSKDD